MPITSQTGSVVAVNTDPKGNMPSLKIERELIPRYTALVDDGERLGVPATLHNIAEIGEAAIKSMNTKLRTHPFTPEGREVLAATEKADAEAMIAVAVEAAIRGPHNELTKVSTELSTPKAGIDPNLAREIRDLLRAKPSQEREHIVGRSDDPQLAAAVMFAPTFEPLVSDNARKLMMLRYNQTHRPTELARQVQLKAHIETVTEFAATIKRRLREILL